MIVALLFVIACLLLALTVTLHDGLVCLRAAVYRLVDELKCAGVPAIGNEAREANALTRRLLDQRDEGPGPIAINLGTIADQTSRILAAYSRVEPSLAAIIRHAATVRKVQPKPRKILLVDNRPAFRSPRPRKP